MIQFAPETVLKQALLHQQRGEFREAEALCRHVVAAHPNHPQALHALGFVLGQRGDKESAVTWIQRAIALAPDDPTMHANLGIWLGELGRFEEALAAHAEALRRIPGSSLAWHNLATAQGASGRADAAAESYRKAVQLDPQNAAAWRNLGSLYAEQGAFAEALECNRRLLRLWPCDAAIHSNVIFLMQFVPHVSAAAIRDELAAWQQQHAAPLAGRVRPHTQNRDPQRRLRIGYISPNLRSHVVGRNMLPLFQHHDPAEFEIYAYSDATSPDAVTERFRTLCRVFHSTEGLSDEAVAERVCADQIDILVDLTLHMDKNRLRVFAMKPAPVQVTFGGYPGSTGLTTVDYRLTDPYLDPPGQDDGMYSERSIRLPSTFWCLDPTADAIPVNDLPARVAGRITFGCLNNFGKINVPLLQLWARVLQAVPASRLMLLAPQSGRQRVLEVMAERGVAAERIAFEGFRPRLAYFELYHEIDIGLDAHPYNGHTTSLESLFMGVPVVTRVGGTVVGRAGLSQLMNLGLPELVAQTDDAFVAIAAGLAGDLPRLAALRGGLRGRMEQSPLMDAPRFAKGIETAYRAMWREWCER